MCSLHDRYTLLCYCWCLADCHKPGTCGRLRGGWREQLSERCHLVPSIFCLRNFTRTATFIVFSSCESIASSRVIWLHCSSSCKIFKKSFNHPVEGKTILSTYILLLLLLFLTNWNLFQDCRLTHYIILHSQRLFSLCFFVESMVLFCSLLVTYLESQNTDFYLFFSFQLLCGIVQM